MTLSDSALFYGQGTSIHTSNEQTFGGWSAVIRVLAYFCPCLFSFYSLNICVWMSKEAYSNICVHAGIWNGIEYFSTVIGSEYSPAYYSIISEVTNEMWFKRHCHLFPGFEHGLISLWTLRTLWYGLCMAWWLNMMSDTNTISLISGGGFCFLWVRLTYLYTQSCIIAHKVVTDTLRY